MSDRPQLELTSNLSWNLAYRVDLTAQKTKDEKAFYPLPRQTFDVPSNRLLIGTKSNSARSTWWLGCRVSVNVLLGGFDATSDFAGYGEVWRENVGLKQLRHVEWPDYKFPTYRIIIFIPFWLGGTTVSTLVLTNKPFNKSKKVTLASSKISPILLKQ
jgi:hypothetical protein